MYMLYILVRKSLPPFLFFFQNPTSFNFILFLEYTEQSGVATIYFVSELEREREREVGYVLFAQLLDV